MKQLTHNKEAKYQIYSMTQMKKIRIRLKKIEIIAEETMKGIIITEKSLKLKIIQRSQATATAIRKIMNFPSLLEQIIQKQMANKDGNHKRSTCKQSKSFMKYKKIN